MIPWFLLKKKTKSSRVFNPLRPEFNFDEHFDNLEKTVSRSSSPPAFDPFLDYNLLDQDPLLGAEGSQAPFLDYSDNPFKDSFNPFAENSAIDPQGMYVYYYN